MLSVLGGRGVDCVFACACGSCTWTGKGGTTGTSESRVGSWRVLRKDLTREPVRCRRERVPSLARRRISLFALLELSLLMLGLWQARKSVLIAVSSDGIGSDIPSNVPFLVRSVNCATLAEGGRLCRRFRRQCGIRNARAAPKMAPGKKPARMAGVGKEGQLFDFDRVLVSGRTLGLGLEEEDSCLEVLDSGAAVGMTAMVSDVEDASSVAVADVVEAVDALVEVLNVDVEDEVDDGDEAEDDEEVLSNTQALLPSLSLHSYPNGQQESPHLGKSSSKRVVLIGLCG